MAPTPTGKRNYCRIPGAVKLLLETPSGFAIFTFDEKYLKKSIEILRLHEFRTFKDKCNVINRTAQRIDVSLIKMLWTYCAWDETLVVGSREYKDIIEKTLGLKCLYDDAVTEVMWGLKNIMHLVVPEEQSKMTVDDRLPMSLGLNMVLNRHKIYIKQEMFLHKMFDEDFKVFSKVDTKVWNLFKLVTALKIMFDPHGILKYGNPHKMFSHDELTAIRCDAHLYQQKLDKDLVLAVYDNSVTLREVKAELLYELRTLVQEAKAALETEEVEEKPAANGVDSRRQVGTTFLQGSDSTQPK
ncbi:hypothetical protein QYE76_058770 [Lolium multiflorum]|uniref:Uncharacterized protein n=1 Tax=Lolium multiflorum TaxID=4521 RepID=A0AAD8T7F4_LOLMU|nr:hypothetical protein QYE76_058770 [Lolium multiflorum]